MRLVVMRVFCSGAAKAHRADADGSRTKRVYASNPQRGTAVIVEDLVVNREGAGGLPVAGLPDDAHVSSLISHG